MGVLCGSPGIAGENVSATPINLPNVAEEPDHGPNSIENSAQTEMIEDRRPETSEEGRPRTEDGETAQVLDETSFKVETPLPDQDLREDTVFEVGEEIGQERDEEILDEDSGPGVLSM